VGFPFDKLFFSIKKYSRRRRKRTAARPFSGHVVENDKEEILRIFVNHFGVRFATPTGADEKLARAVLRPGDFLGTDRHFILLISNEFRGAIFRGNAYDGPATTLRFRLPPRAPRILRRQANCPQDVKWVV
jgi:hypothetical protein